jgi:hypothetical protein
MLRTMTLLFLSFGCGALKQAAQDLSETALDDSFDTEMLGAMLEGAEDSLEDSDVSDTDSLDPAGIEEGTDGGLSRDCVTRVVECPNDSGDWGACADDFATSRPDTFRLKWTFTECRRGRFGEQSGWRQVVVDRGDPRSITMERDITRSNRHHEAAIKTTTPVVVSASGTRAGGTVERSISGAESRVHTREGTEIFNVEVANLLTVKDSFSESVLTRRELNGTMTAKANHAGVTLVAEITKVVREPGGDCLCPVAGEVTQTVTVGEGGEESARVRTITFSGECGEVLIVKTNADGAETETEATLPDCVP